MAVAIAKAKLSRASADEAITLAEDIIDTEPECRTPSGPFWRLAYHPVVLLDLCRLRMGLLRRRSEAAALLRAIALGCLHGPLLKDKASSSYFSNQMPRTFAPKPDYSVRFWKKEQIRPPHVSLIGVLKKKAARLKIEDLPQAPGVGHVIVGNAESPGTFMRLPGRFDAVITSPPYYGMVNYVQDQWLRNWFLGGPDEVDYARTEQLSHCGVEGFATSLAKVWDNVGDACGETLDLFIRFGAIPSKRVKPVDLLARSLSLSKHSWDVLSVKSAKSSHFGKRQASHMQIDSRSVREYDIHATLA